MKLKVYDSPCVVDGSKVLLSANIGKKIDLKKMEEHLKESEIKELKISRLLGVLKGKHGEKSVMIFNSGKIQVRKANDEKDAMKTIDVISEALKKMGD